MASYHFGLGRGHLPEEADQIARRHDARLVNYTEPNGEKRHWFTTQNLGDPFDRATAQAVLADLEDAGIRYAEGGET